MILEAPNYLKSDIALAKKTWLFPAGGITGVEDWQTPYCESLDNEFDDLILTNPRRNFYDLEDPEQGRIQIKWEFHHLGRANIITFWFAKGRIQPITIFEYATYLKAYTGIGYPDHLLIAVHPEYERRFDLVEQTKLVAPNLPILSNLDELQQEVRHVLYKMRQPLKRKGAP